MNDILTRIIASKREEILALQARQPLAALQEAIAAAPPPRDFAAALRGRRQRGDARADAVRIIAELKPRSPSKGAFCWHGDVTRQINAYQQGGAAAISVLTDKPYFGGSPELFCQVRGLSTLPVLQKDFLLEPYQLAFARALGADAVLLIARILPGALLSELLEQAWALGLEVLVEVVDAPELARAGAAGARVIGVNNRDLRTFTTDLAQTLRLAPLCGEEQVLITESGIHSSADVQRMLRAGVDGFLIGEALMTAPDAAARLRELRGEQEAAS